MLTKIDFSITITVPKTETPKSLECPVCDKVFETPQQITSHQSRRHKEIEIYLLDKSDWSIKSRKIWLVPNFEDFLESEPQPISRVKKLKKKTPMMITMP